VLLLRFEFSSNRALADKSCEIFGIVKNYFFVKKKRAILHLHGNCAWKKREQNLHDEKQQCAASGSVDLVSLLHRLFQIFVIFV